MSREATELLEAFDALPEEERRVIAAELFRRALPFDSGPLEDEETAQAADELFRCLEAEEAESNDTSAR
ncbi:MAG: hypothetical protein NW208_16230 [Bryobacter sp.]|nr:hypothetical protein [Bryobacter sp.]